MGEETYKLEQHIAEERENLGRNLDEIEYRFKDATDLKAHFDRNIGWVLGAAVAGGFLLSWAVRRSSAPDAAHDRQSTPRERVATLKDHSTRFLSPHLTRVSATVDNIVTGLVGVFSDKLQSFVADAVPGFREQFDSVKRGDHRAAGKPVDFDR